MALKYDPLNLYFYFYIYKNTIYAITIKFLNTYIEQNDKRTDLENEPKNSLLTYL